jgi:hypothetical protein
MLLVALNQRARIAPDGGKRGRCHASDAALGPNPTQSCDNFAEPWARQPPRSYWTAGPLSSMCVPAAGLPAARNATICITQGPAPFVNAAVAV